MLKISNLKRIILIAKTGIILFFGIFVHADKQPSMTIGKCAKAPRIDGIISPGEWNHAACGGGLSGIAAQRDELLDIQPAFYLAFDDKNLYFAAITDIDNVSDLNRKYHKRDSAVYRDDSVEFFIDPGKTKKDYYQFVINSLGTLFDGKNNRGGWNAKGARAAAGIKGKKWIIELSVPFADLNTKCPVEGEKWGMNIGLNCKYKKLTGTWAHLMSFHNPRDYGELIFTHKGPVAAVSGLNTLALGNGKIAVKCVGTNKVTSHLKIWEQDNKKKIEADASGYCEDEKISLLPFKLSAAPKGKARLYDGAINITSGDKRLMFLPFSIRKTDMATVQLNALPDIGKLEVEILASSSLAASGNCTAEISIGATGKSPGETRKVKGLSTKKARIITFNRNDIPKGDITVGVKIADKHGENVFSYSRNLEKPLNPDWYNDRTGSEAVIPPPYKPLQTKGMAVKPWGRSYQLGACLLPGTVTAANASLLAGPVRFKTVVNSRQLYWFGEKKRILAKSSEKVTMAGSANCGLLKLSSNALIEYDGMIKVDLIIKPAKGIYVNELTLQIPFKPEYVKYLYHLGVKWRTVSNAGKFPEKGFKSSFIPYIWLGDNKRGFSWFCESTKNWYPADRKDAVSIKREKKHIMLELRLIKNKKIIKPLKYTFGFQATPVKEPGKTVWDYRISHHCAGYGIQSKPGFPNGAGIQYSADEIINGNRGTFEMWIRPSYDSDPARKNIKAPDVPFFKLDIDPQTQYGLSWFGNSKNLCLWSFLKGKKHKLLETPVKWRKGQWYHVAFSWGKRLAIYVNGKLTASKPFDGLVKKKLENAYIYIGNVGWNTCGAPEWVDEIRISDIPRKPELSKQPYKTDKNTLLLDHLDQDIKTFHVLKTSPSVPGNYSGEFLGAPEGGEGKYGKAVRLRSKRSLVSQLADAGAKTLCIHSFWSWMGYPWVPPEKREYLRKLVKACHEKGIKLLVYSSPLTPDQAPEWDIYHKYFLVDPIKWPYRYAGGKHLAPACCWNCRYRNLRLAMQAKLIKDYDIDGFYADSSEWPLKCKNRNHGCGYKNEKGEVIKTYNLFGTRDYMKRQYVLTKMLKPDGQVNVHNSAVMCTPTLGWCTSSWDGEQLGPLTRTSDNSRDNLKYVLSLLPLDTFRAEFMGRQWGIPSELLCKERSYTTPQLLAITLLHHVLVRPNPAYLGRISAIWRLHDEFDMKKSKWYPYWSNADIVKTNADTVKVSAYRNPGKGFLMLVSNLSPDKRNVNVKFNTSKLKMNSGKLTAFDAISKNSIKLSKNIVSFEMKPFSYRYVWIK
jgi:hypothetical protein